MTKNRGIAALRQLDDQHIVFARAQVIFSQPCAQPGGLGAYNRVLFGIMIRPAAEHLDSDHGFFDVAISALQVLLDDEPQESG